MDALIDKIGSWFSKPIREDLDMGNLLLYFALFAVVTWFVYDTLNILRKGQV